MRSSRPGRDAAALSERVRRLEAKSRKKDAGLVSRMTVAGSAIALTLSLITGGYTVFDNFVSSPRREIEARKSEMRRIISRLTELNWRIMEASFSGQNDLALAISQTANAEKISVLAQAGSLFSSLPDGFAFSEYVLLSAESLNIGDSGKALDYADAGIAAATNGAMRAEGLRYKARVLFAPGPTQDFPAARRMLRQSIDTAKQEGTFTSAWTQANAYSEWIMAEMAFGACDNLQGLYKAMVSDLQNLIPAQQLSSYRTAIATAYNSQQRCSASFLP